MGVVSENIMTETGKRNPVYALLFKTLIFYYRTVAGNQSDMWEGFIQGSLSESCQTCGRSPAYPICPASAWADRKWPCLHTPVGRTSCCLGEQSDEENVEPHVRRPSRGLFWVTWSRWGLPYWLRKRKAQVIFPAHMIASVWNHNCSTRLFWLIYSCVRLKMKDMLASGLIPAWIWWIPPCIAVQYKSYSEVTLYLLKSLQDTCSGYLYTCTSVFTFSCAGEQSATCSIWMLLSPLPSSLDQKCVCVYAYPPGTWI